MPATVVLARLLSRLEPSRWQHYLSELRRQRVNVKRDRLGRLRYVS
jgi:hypothetical protein